MLKLPHTRKNTAVAAPTVTYRAACTAACETAEGARALSEEILAREQGLSHDSSGLKTALRKQVEVAKHAAMHRSLELEIFHRIPAACQRDEDQASGAIKDAEQEVHIAEMQVSAARKRYEHFTASANEKRAVCDAASQAVSKNLQAAEAELQSARDKEDAAAMSRAAEEVVRARKDVITVQDRNSAMLLEANSFAELADKAQAEMSAAQGRVKAAKEKRHEAHMALLAVHSDRKSLEALLAHARWFIAHDLVAKTRVPSHIDNAHFFFHQAERGPKWDGRQGSTSLGNQHLNGYRGILFALREPDWNAFDVDPSSVVENSVSHQVI